jgi:hypothetical protein
MPNEEVETIQTGQVSWNVADAFVRIKVFKPMWECDKFEMIALYGTEDTSENLPPEMIIQKRIEALFRFKDTLKLIIENVNFTIRKPDRAEFEGIRKHLTFIEEMLDATYSIEENQVLHTKNVVINEVHFRKCLRALQKLKEQLHVPLNGCGIIFRQSDEMDIDEIMNDIVQGG